MLHGDCLFSRLKTNILQDFVNFLSANEAAVLQKALVAEVLEEKMSEEVVDILQDYDCKVLIRKDNIEKVLIDIGHKEIIQKPMFIIDNWQTVLHDLMLHEDLNIIYEKRKIIAKNVLTLLNPGDWLSVSENKVFEYIKKYIKVSDTKSLKLFLRFCTGADVITNKKINIVFNDNSGILQVPTAHTCACNFEVSRLYDSYIVFRSDLNKILSSNYWVMDFV